MRTPSRYEPANERRKVAYGMNVMESNHSHKEIASNMQRLFFDPSELHERQKQLNEWNELRSHFLSAASAKYDIPYRPLKIISTTEKIFEKGLSLNGLKKFLLGLFYSVRS